MSFDRLMQHARDIEQNAARAEYDQQVRRSSMSGTPGATAFIDYDKIAQKYQGSAVPLFEPFSRMPDPGLYDGMIKDVAGAMSDLSQGHMTDPINEQHCPASGRLNRISSAGDQLQEWTGEAADRFKRHFLDPFPAVATNQFILLAIMKGALEAHRAIWDRARKDIDNIAHQTLSALDNVGSCGKNEWSFAFSVAAAVAAVGAIPLTGGASAGIAALGAVGATGSAGMAGAEAVKASGGSAEQVVRSMTTAIDKLTGEIRDAEQKIVQVLDDNAGKVEQGVHTFVSARPTLAGMEGKQLTGEQGLGGSE